MRLDKYLKVSRIIKRRTVAKDVCDGGKVKINGRVAKAGAEVKPANVPKPTSCTLSPCCRLSVTASSTAFTAFSESFFVSPAFSATLATNYFNRRDVCVCDWTNI